MILRSIALKEKVSVAKLTCCRLYEAEYEHIITFDHLVILTIIPIIFSTADIHMTNCCVFVIVLILNIIAS